MKIFTDGSSRGNPGPGGWAAILISFDAAGSAGIVRELGGREAHTTNNRMEMSAALNALEYAARLAKSEEHVDAITVITDSAYLLNGITKWVKGWKQKDWISSQKTEVLNRDIWEKLSDAVDALAGEKVKLTWKLVKGHAGHSLNERCDEIATTFADDAEIDLYDGSLAKYGHAADLLKTSAPSAGSASNKKSKSSAPAYSYISMVGGKIKIDKTWKECEARVRGISGVRFKKSTSASDEKKIVQEFEGK